jgi:hypothetical protein
MKERINKLWEHLDHQHPLEKGYVKTLVDSSLSLSAFLAVVYPKRNKALLIEVPEKAHNPPEPFTGKAMKLEFMTSEDDQIHRYVMLSLTDSSFSQVFDVFLEDCLNAISTGSGKQECLKIFTDRLNTWRQMLETYSESGLSSSAQQGLFGEMVVLLRLLKVFPNRVLELVTAWQGPDKFRQDFQCNDWGIEVKTTTRVDSVTIANETQLSSAGLTNLFLWHLVLDRYKGQGATLNDLVAELKSYTTNNAKANDILNIRLATSGYYVHQSLLYEGVGYFIRQEKAYAVTDGFPGLTPQNVPFGISEIKYTLNLSACVSFIIPEKNVYSIINF